MSETAPKNRTLFRALALTLAVLCAGCGKTVTASGQDPAAQLVLLTEENSTRAVALDALTLRRDPFTTRYSVTWGQDNCARITLFATGLRLQPGESALAVSADAEDWWTGEHHPLVVENVRDLADCPGVESVTVRLAEEIAGGSDLNIRITADGLTSNPARVVIGADSPPAAVSGPLLDRLELVADKTTTGDGGNSWGAHKTRIVRTSNGDLFTAYTVDGGGQTDREWRLAQRTEKGWKVITQGPAGREPVNLLRAPNDKLYVVGWPGGLPQVWGSSVLNGALQFSAQPVPGAWPKTDWPYHAAGISDAGDICVVQSAGDKPGQFFWAYYSKSADKWASDSAGTDYRYTYAFVFPLGGGSFSLVAEKDVKWASTGFTQPPGAFDYVKDGVKYWALTGPPDSRLQGLQVKEEAQSTPVQFVTCYHRDVYKDTKGRTHILYVEQGDLSHGKLEAHHAIVENGAVTKDVTLPAIFNAEGRMTQDSSGRFYLLAVNNSQLLVYGSDSEDGTQLNTPVAVDLKGYNVDTSLNGFQIVTPRSGTPASDVVDGLFASGGGEKLIYFRLRLH